MATPNAFRFNTQQSGTGYNNPALNDLINRGKAAELELYGGDAPEVSGPPSGMEIIDGVTSDIHEAWSQLQDYAHQMWANYRINVTRPDRSNPEAVKANQIFQKNLAKLQYAGEVLKQSNTQLGKAQEAQIEGKGYLPVVDGATPYINRGPNEQFVNTELSPAAQQANQAYAKTYETQGATDAAQAAIDTQRAATGQPYRDAGMTRQAEALENQFQGPVRERDWRRDLPRGGSQDTPLDPTNLINQVRNIRIGALRGDKSAVGQLIGKDGIIDARTVNTGEKQGIMLTYPKGRTRFISTKTEDSVYGGLDLLTDIMQSDVPAKDRVQSTTLYPYFEEGARLDVRDIADIPENERQKFQDMEDIFKNLHTKKDSSYDTDDGKVVIPSTQKKGLVQDLQTMANAGQLFTGKGYQILEIDWDDGVIELKYNDEGYEESIILDPATKIGQREFKKLLEYNSELFSSPTNDQYIRGPVNNSQTGTTSKDGITFEEYLENVRKMYPRKDD